MKKIITTVILAAMLTTTFAGCKDDTNSSGTGNSSVSDTSNNSSENNSSENSESSAPADSSNSDAGTSTPDATASKKPVERLSAVFSKYDFFNPNEGMAMVVAGPDVDAIQAVFPAPADPEKPTHCVSMYEEGANAVNMMELTDLPLEDCEDYVMAFPMMSASLKRIVIVKPAAGKEEAISTTLSAYAEAQKQGRPMEYPAWEEERAGTVFGKTADGCFYVVIAAEGADIGSTIENA